MPEPKIGATGIATHYHAQTEFVLPKGWLSAIIGILVLCKLLHGSGTTLLSTIPWGSSKCLTFMHLNCPCFLCNIFSILHYLKLRTIKSFINKTKIFKIEKKYKVSVPFTWKELFYSPFFSKKVLCLFWNYKFSTETKSIRSGFLSQCTSLHWNNAALVNYIICLK